MKLRLHQQNELHCHITRKDLESKSLKLNEFTQGTEAARQLFREIMEQAAIEFNFNTENTPLTIKAVPVDSNNITLIISKKHNAQIINFNDWISSH